MKRKLSIILLVLAILGIIDAVYLTYEHFSDVILPCTVNRLIPFLSDCGAVLRSQYALIFGVPIALIGLAYYIILSSVTALAIFTEKKLFWFLFLFQSMLGTFVSFYLMFIQFIVLRGFCQYCTFSALISFTIFTLALAWLDQERQTVAIYFSHTMYRYILKPVLFLINPETIHEFILNFGEQLGKISFKKRFLQFFFDYKNPKLHQNIAGIDFENPVGLAAGFDYQAKLTQILPSLGFCFFTIGTVTNLPYAGNPSPMLGRLPKSKSLMVNKGFKNIGANKICEKIMNKKMLIPTGISIGISNSPKLTNLHQGIFDIMHAFTTCERSNINISYYELNISCPNLIHSQQITFYPSENLKSLLLELEKLSIKKPVFVKMPIEKNNKQVVKMLDTIIHFKFIKGVIFGNLQTDRSAPTLDPHEVKKFKVGKFSGKPCQKRSNELIKLAYQKYGKKLIIIGCGGIFSSDDAYKKIKLGASLVQLITGLIYEGPTLVAKINLGLTEQLKKDGFNHISDAIGTNNIK